MRSRDGFVSLVVKVFSFLPVPFFGSRSPRHGCAKTVLSFDGAALLWFFVEGKVWEGFRVCFTVFRTLKIFTFQHCGLLGFVAFRARRALGLGILGFVFTEAFRFHFAGVGFTIFEV